MFIILIMILDILAVGVAVGTQGTLQVIRDMGLKEPFCGTVPLQTGEMVMIFLIISWQVNKLHQCFL